MKATKNWGECQCGCRRQIEAGDEFVIRAGVFYLEGHADRRKPLERTPRARTRI